MAQPTGAAGFNNKTGLHQSKGAFYRMVEYMILLGYGC